MRALCLLATLGFAPIATAQGPEPAPTITELRPGDDGYKSPDIAMIWGILFTGAGHIYARETSTGLAFFAGSNALAGLAIWECVYDDCTEGVVYPLLFGAVLVKVWSIVDAKAAARHTNRVRAPQVSLGPLNLRASPNRITFSLPLP